MMMKTRKRVRRMTCHQDNASDQGTVGRSLLFAEGRDLSSAKERFVCTHVQFF